MVCCVVVSCDVGRADAVGCCVDVFTHVYVCVCHVCGGSVDVVIKH